MFQYPEQAIACALWVLHTWLFRAFDYTPYLWVYAADKRLRKSRLLEVLKLLSHNAELTESGSAAALVRSIDEANPLTILLDEVDCVYDKKKNDVEADSLRKFLNAGYRRGATFLRCVGQGSNQVPTKFPAFCPKALAGIGRDLPDTVQDRSLPIELVRQSREERAERFRDREARGETALIVAELDALAQQQQLIDQLREARPALPEKLSDCQQDITEPLVAIADLAGGEWPTNARAALVKLFGQEEDASFGVRLLVAIKAAFDNSGEDRLTTRQLLDALVANEDGPWASMFEDALKHDKLQTAAARLAGLLKPYKRPDGQKIKVRPIKVDGEPAKGFYRSDFEAACSRWLPSSRTRDTRDTVDTLEGKMVTAAVPVTATNQTGVTDFTKEVATVATVAANPEGDGEALNATKMSDNEAVSQEPENWWLVYPFNEPEPEWIWHNPTGSKPAPAGFPLDPRCEVCGEKGLFDDPCLPDTHYWFNIKTRAVRCQSCQEMHWWADGYEIDEFGMPSCWDHEHTREERIAERTRYQLQKAAQYRAHKAGRKDWWPVYQALLAQEPEETRRMIEALCEKEKEKEERAARAARAEAKRGMTPGEFIAEATRLFNATPAQ